MGGVSKALKLLLETYDIFIFQPPHSSKLNRIEQFWKFLKSQLQWEKSKTIAQLKRLPNRQPLYKTQW